MPESLIDILESITPQKLSAHELREMDKIMDHVIAVLKQQENDVE